MCVCVCVEGKCNLKTKILLSIYLFDPTFHSQRASTDNDFEKI